MGKPILLDLFCGGGGCSMGYARAGFQVVGVDFEPHPNYPFEFHQADALTFPLDGFDVLHASPPCQEYSVTRNLHNTEYPKLIGPVRARLQAIGVPYVIENVEGARSDMLNPITLCGSQFNLTTWWEGYGRVGLRRHRLFESNVLIPEAGPHDHSLRSVPVYGHGPGGKREAARWPVRKGAAKAAREVMGIDWMTRRELDESIPPAYTEYIGQYLMDAVIFERKNAA